MEEKKADNKVLENKAKIKEIDSRIDDVKNRGKKLDDMEEIVDSLNKNIDKCLELLGKSVKGNNYEKRLDAYQTENKINYKKNIGYIEAQRDLIKNKITRLNKEKEDLIKENNKEEE